MGESSEPLLPHQQPPSPSHVQIPMSPSFKDLLIFGPSVFLSDLPHPTPPPSLSPSPSAPTPTPPPRCQHSLHRSRTAPAMAPIDELLGQHHRLHSPPPPSRPSLAFLCILLSVYLSFGVTVYSLNRSHFASTGTHPVVDAFYFCIVTMCTIGYGDITPTSPFAKLFSVFFVLAGFGFLDVLLSSM